jgi:hypothetical protein
MAAAAPIAAVASIASIGLSAMGTVAKGEGEKAADDFKAARAEESAKFGRLQAELTDTTLREQLNVTLANIDAIRASGDIDPRSPTGAAITARNESLSDRQRTAQLVTLRSQAASDEAGARYLRSAGDYALSQSYMQAGAGIAGGLAKGFGPGGSFALGG